MDRAFRVSIREDNLSNSCRKELVPPNMSPMAIPGITGVLKVTVVPWEMSQRSVFEPGSITAKALQADRAKAKMDFLSMPQELRFFSRL